MNMINAKDALDLFLVSAPSCPSALAMRALIDAAREFCDMTGVHKEPSDKLKLIENMTSYEFDSPSKDLSVVRLSGMNKPGKSIRNTYMIDRPESEGRLYGTLVLAPSYTARSLWEPLVQSYGEALAAGALSRLLSKSGTQFYNPQQSSLEAARFSDWIHNSRMQIEQPSRVKMHRGMF